VAAVCAILVGPAVGSAARTARGRAALAAIPLALALVAGLGGPAAYAVDTAGTTHTGAIPTSGPQTAGFFGGGFPGRGLTGRGGPGGARGEAGGPGGFGNGPGAARGSGGTGTAGGTGTGTPGIPRGTGTGRTGTGTPGAGASRAGGIGFGGLSGRTQVGSALTRLLKQNASAYKWVAATVGSQEASPLELATGDAVMAIGGFNGTDPAPTLAQFQAMVAKHEIHYYIGRNSESFGGGTGSSSIASWVAAHFKATTAGGTTVYNLTQPKTG
jgi:hypothetical protein